MATSISKPSVISAGSWHGEAAKKLQIVGLCLRTDQQKALRHGLIRLVGRASTIEFGSPAC